MLRIRRIDRQEIPINMTDVYVIRNQLGHYWAKSKTWVDGSEPRTVMRSKHRDEAINTLVELGSRDFELRGEVLAVALSERGEPVIEASQIPLVLEPETPAELAVEEPNAALEGAADSAPVAGTTGP